jgi:hypothetical protein
MRGSWSGWQREDYRIAPPAEPYGGVLRPLAQARPWHGLRRFAPALRRRRKPRAAVNG